MNYFAVSTNLTSTASNAAFDTLADLASGSIVAPASAILGGFDTDQTVSIAGYVEAAYMAIAGYNTVNIHRSLLKHRGSVAL